MFGVVSEQAFQEAVLIALEQKNRLIYEVALALLSLRNQGNTQDAGPLVCMWWEVMMGLTLAQARNMTQQTIPGPR